MYSTQHLSSTVTSFKYVPLRHLNYPRGHVIEVHATRHLYSPSSLLKCRTMHLRQYALRHLLLKFISLGYSSTERRHFFLIFGISAQQHVPFDHGSEGWRINSVLADEKNETTIFVHLHFFNPFIIFFGTSNRVRMVTGGSYPRGKLCYCSFLVDSWEITFLLSFQLNSFHPLFLSLFL